MEVLVPPTYQSDQGAKIRLESLRSRVSDSYKRDPATPLRLELSFDCNAEGVARLAEFFGLYDREGWDRAAGTALLSGGRALPPAAPSPPLIEDGILDGEFTDDGGES
jgi:hypothetical protein